MKRISQYPILPVILERWSARAMSDEIVSHEELMKLFEAARWAPSSYNAQQWRFIYTRRDTSPFTKMFDLLVPFNKSWAYRASHLILVVSKNNFTYNNEYSRTHSFDTGAAWQNLALQASADGLVVHAMEGFDYDKAKKDFFVPEKYTIEAMVAVGKPGRIEDLSEELQQREVLSDRKPIAEFVFEDFFKE